MLGGELEPCGDDPVTGYDRHFCKAARIGIGAGDPDQNLATIGVDVPGGDISKVVANGIGDIDGGNAHALQA